MTHLTTALERSTYAVTSAFGLALLWVSASAESLFAQVPSAPTLGDVASAAPRWDYTVIAGAVLVIGMNLATVLVTLYKGIKKVRDESVVGQLVTEKAATDAVRVRLESVQREARSDTEHREKWFADELAHRDQRLADREREYEHAKNNRLAQLETLRDDIAYLKAANERHRATEADLRRMLADATRNLGDGLVQSTQNTGRLLNSAAVTAAPEPAPETGTPTDPN